MSFSSSVPSPGNPGLESGSLILIVEDESEIAEILAAYLARSGMRSLHASDGIRALDLHSSLNPNLVILDVQIPAADGWQVLSAIRHRGNTPVIMLTAMDQDVDKLTGLRIGADDYVVKPFNPAEVVARVQAVLRRSSMGKERHQRVLRVDEFQIDLDSHEASVLMGQRFQPLTLTLTEFKLLEHLARSPNRVFSRGELLVACLPEGDALERTVDSHMSKLRRKLEDLGVRGIPVSIRGVGYRLRRQM